jgi:uncharacterized repeat protein (TIGR01451 family)
MKKAIIFAFAVIILFAPVVAFADMLDTVAGTPITAEGINNFMRYTDAGGAPKDVVSSESITTVVMPMYGFGGLNSPADQVTTPGIYKSYTYTITNEGNKADRYNLSTNIAYVNGAGNWTVLISDESGATINSVDVSEDGSQNVIVTVVPSTLSTSGQSPNGSYALVSLEAQTPSTPVGVYLGANGDTYGGTSDATDSTVTSIETSVMAISRTALVDSPTNYSGGRHDAVPGAVITYTILVSNEGGAPANSVIIIDKVPTSTEAAHIGASSGAQNGLPNVSVTAALPTDIANGWTAYYSTSSNPSTQYGVNNGTDWITVAEPKRLDTVSGVTYVKWEKTGVTDVGTTFNWGVTIR